MPTKLTHEQIRILLESRAVALITKEYHNTLQKLNVSCSIHGPQIVTAKQIRLGGGCYDCGQETKVAGRRLSIEFVKREVEKAGYEFKANSYKNSKTPFLANCAKHGEFNTTYDYIKGNHGCRACGYDTVGDKKRTPFDDIKEYVATTPYILISENRSSYKEKVTLECKIHGQFSIALCNLKIGQGCEECGHIKAGKARRMSHEDFCKRIAHLGYEILTPYVTSHTFIIAKCPKHGEFDVVPYSLLQGHQCAKCANSESKAEKELFEEMKKVYSTAKKLRSRVNDPSRPYLKRFEADIFIPHLNKGIEFDGTHWHKFETMRMDEGKRKWSDEDLGNYHDIKDAHFLSIGIKILHIKETEWNLDKQSCIKRCLDFLSQ